MLPPGELLRYKNTSGPQRTKGLIFQFKKRLTSRECSESKIDNIVLETESINTHGMLIESTTKQTRENTAQTLRYGLMGLVSHLSSCGVAFAMDIHVYSQIAGLCWPSACARCYHLLLNMLAQYRKVTSAQCYFAHRRNVGVTLAHCRQIHNFNVSSMSGAMIYSNQYSSNRFLIKISQTDLH